MNSWVVWFKDGRYTYAWGETAEEARATYLKEWEAGITRVAPAGDYPSALPITRYVAPFTVHAVPGQTPPLYDEKGKRMPEDDLWP